MNEQVEDSRIRSADGGLPSAVRWSHLLIEDRLRAGDVAIDATAGNGYDTLFLAERVLPGGHVFAFDVQSEALVATSDRLLAAGIPAESFTLILAGHEHLAEKLSAGLKGRIQAVMFNLGYLPGSDRSVITEVSKTTRAIGAAIEWLAPGGIMTVVVYPGHAGGAGEAREVERLAAQMPPREIEAQHICAVNRSASPPECWVFWKRR